MKRITNSPLLKRSVCLIALFMAYPFLQINSFSSERHALKVVKMQKSSIPLFLKLDEELFMSYDISPCYQFVFEEKTIAPPQKIYSKGFLKESHLADFLNTYNPQLNYLEAKQFASDYIKYCNVEGINHDIAFAQMCLETGYLKFKGSVSAHQNNFCGLGAVDNHSPGESFKTREIGIIAHVQHLKAYASTDRLNSPLVDMRFKFVKRGSVETIHDLTGKWATDP